MDQAEVEDDYAVMSCSAGRDAALSQQPLGGGGGGGSGGPSAYLDMNAELRGAGSSSSAGTLGSGVNVGGNGGGGGVGGGAVDNGYMAMLPGVTATPPSSVSNSLVVAVAEPDVSRHPPCSSDTAVVDADDYMAMTPSSSVSPPQSIRPPPPTAVADGYMMMSPNGSCSPDQRGLAGAWFGSGSADSRAGSDYMNMSPISARSASGSPPLPPLLSEHHARSDPHGNVHTHHHGSGTQPLPPQSQTVQPAPKMVYSYYSLPRSYKHNPTGRFEDGPGRGKRLSAGGHGGGGNRVAGGSGFRAPGANGGSKLQDPHLAGGGPLSGRHLSLSSSSYSSSSASSESLGEGEEKTSHGGAAAAGGGGGGPRAGTRAKDGLQQDQHQQQYQGQRRGSAGLKQQQKQQQQQAGLGQRSRPVSLFVDVSKANTLPRVRESPLPPEPKSPGEYVSIEFKGEHCPRAGGASVTKAGASGGRGFRPGFSIPPTSTSSSSSSSGRPLPRPMSCLAGFLPVSPGATPALPPSATSEYVNMDLGPSPSPSPLSLTPLGFPSFSTPPTPPLPAASAPKARDELRPGLSRPDEGAGKESRPGQQQLLQQPQPVAPDSPTACGDYTEMAFSLNTSSTPTTSSTSSPKGPSPDRPESIPGPGAGLGLALGLPLDFPLGAGSKQGLNPDHGAKVIRADPQGRRRHCSETFLAASASSAAVSSVGSSSSSSSMSGGGGGGVGGLPEHAQAVARRFGFDSILWGGSITTSATSSDSPSQHGPPAPPSAQASSSEQGLNYIDLDLVNKESPHSALDQAQTIPARLFSSVMGGGSVGVTSAGLAAGASNLNTYASIDFYKSEELRTHQSTGKDTGESRVRRVRKQYL